GDGPQRGPPGREEDRQVHDGRVRPDPARRRLPPAGPEDRPAVLLPAVEDDPGPHRRRRRRELLRPGRPPADRPGRVGRRGGMKAHEDVPNRQDAKAAKKNEEREKRGMSADIDNRLSDTRTLLSVPDFLGGLGVLAVRLSSRSLTV